MTRIFLCLALPFCMVAYASAATLPVSEPAYAFTDLTDDYTRFFDRTASLKESARVAAFEADFIPLLPDFYGKARFPDRSQEKFDARIARSFAGFPAIRERYTRTAVAFQTMLSPALDKFRQTFPDMQALPPVYLLHSLGEMDGGTREVGGRIVLIFGVDVMANAHDFSDEQPFLDHELFHVHHQRYFPGCEQVWCSLWTEGLAVYVAQQMNPQSSDSQLLLTQPEPIRTQIDAHLEDSVCTARKLLSSGKESDMEALFSFKRLNANIPPRAGYYIGYLAARQAGKIRSLKQLARLSPADARPVLEQALDALATCR